MMTIARIASRLIYDAGTGLFTWARREETDRYAKSWNGRWAGKSAGTINYLGYVYLHMEGHDILAHRAAWAVHYGRLPEGQIDHINGDPSDNRIENLREATQSQNNANQGLKVTNTSGHRGVTWNKRRRKWQAQIQLDKRHRVIGHFDSLEDASIAYQSAAIQAFGEFYRVVSP
ncbi:HNH endonuclease [Mesorhizobium sp. M0955]|uniref:HNH endonuclease n=1 Tax=Mesorhizobium sp. M0955 TaxID=2957033 RepID=UPI0033382055